jgi:beta-phosphoglucomutase-like phosphatase (HAD superfamily)
VIVLRDVRLRKPPRVRISEDDYDEQKPKPKVTLATVKWLDKPLPEIK